MKSFTAVISKPREAGDGDTWGFVVLPFEISETLPRRGRSSIDGRIKGHAFTALLEPDGKKSHWLRLDASLLDAVGVSVGEKAEFEVAPVDREPEPSVPDDFANALNAHAEAKATWDSTTTLARVDWIHWIETAKQAKTRAKRIADACDMLAEGKKRVCCFDPSGFYSKALCAPAVDDE